MRNLLAFLAAALLAFAGVGWYLGWYKIQSSTTSSGHQNVNIDIDRPKINDAAHNIAAGLARSVEKRKDGTESVESSIKPVPDKPPVNPLNPQ